LAPLLAQLVSVGLVTEQREEPDDANPNLTCHELVRERIHAWMEQHPDEAGSAPASGAVVGAPPTTGAVSSQTKPPVTTSPAEPTGEGADWQRPGRARSPLPVESVRAAENAIRLAYAERLEAEFKALMHQNMTAALQAGSRALVYCVQAGAWDRLGGFASRLVTSTRDPRLLEALIPHLQTAAESAPEGEPRWSCLSYLADSLRQSGRPDASLPFFEQAAAQARAVAEAGGDGSRQAWKDLAWISGNWANALREVGDLDAARQRQLAAAEADKKAGNPTINVIGSELEALRIDIEQGKAAAALPEVEARLAQVEAWWQQHRSGQPVPEAPDAEFLARALISALDIAMNAHVAREDWPSALRRIDDMLGVRRALKRPEEEIAGDRMNRANVLGRLRRFGEAKAELEACLTRFENYPTESARTLGSLAILFEEQGDMAQAIIQQRRALALCEQLPDPADRASSHNNLANYLERSGTPSALAESARHRLAALLYRLVAGLGQELQSSLRNYVLRFRRAHAAGTVLAVPRVTALLADPAFAPLEQWLRQRQVPLDQLQAAVDQYLDQARQAALASPEP
jgi:tetratricopeptide (TPR) repeat protein